MGPAVGYMGPQYALAVGCVTCVYVRVVWSWWVELGVAGDVGAGGVARLVAPTWEQVHPSGGKSKGSSSSSSSSGGYGKSGCKGSWSQPYGKNAAVCKGGHSKGKHGSGRAYY